MKKISKEILHIAIPSIISNITVPLLGLIDVSIVGHLGSASYIGAIAVGGMLFSMIYWIFGFLRMGTGGLTSQAYGRKDSNESTRILIRSLSISIILALFLIIMQVPARSGAFMFIDASDEVKHLATIYFHICIWGAPATLGLYSFTGWFIGMQNSRYPMYIAITQNIVNIAASLFFVLCMDMKVEGVALGTLIAQYSGFIMACILALKYYKKGNIRTILNNRQISAKQIFGKEEMLVFFKINRDIFLRTICLVSVTVFFTSTGASYGDTVLAVNTLLMQLFTLFSYIMDGFAYAGEALTGKYIGAKDTKALNETIRHLFYWGTGSAILFTIIYGTGGEDFLKLLTNDSEVISASGKYFYWVLAIPAVGFSAFLIDGICIGATATHIMLRSMVIAVICFFGIYCVSNSYIGNHALWMSFIIYLLIRGLAQALLTRRYLSKHINNIH